MNASAKTWASLSLYESPELVRRLGEEATGRRPGAAKAREISAHFSQAREYFRGATGAGELVRPLLVYYGAVALARGATLFLDTSKSKLVTGHGLDASGWPDLLTRPDALADSEVEIGSGGTFPELARVTANTERVRVQAEQSPGVADASSPGRSLAEGDVITVKEILGQIPDVAALYETTFSEHSRRLRSEVIYTGLPESRKPGEEILRDEKTRRHAWLGVVRGPLGYPPEGWAEDLIEAGGRGRLGRVRNEGFLHFPHVPHQAPVGRLYDLHFDAGSQNELRLEMPLAVSASGEEYLKLPTDGGVVISTLLALHLVAYAAGMLVRYHPGYWAMLTGRTKGEAIGPVLSAAVSAVEERYPALILEAIGVELSFGCPDLPGGIVIPRETMGKDASCRLIGKTFADSTGTSWSSAWNGREGGTRMVSPTSRATRTSRTWWARSRRRWSSPRRSRKPIPDGWWETPSSRRPVQDRVRP